ncbi:hypothetical protein CDAR_119121 [Caerostris darwini]|uniref:Uncharacterized protein n=1 Tax=Caerostris darwini TaxID=1538125 RepID=A0AAV4VAH6_9ARAC|nr:hypothetical protein CDAR_119121 [Caerostris darwini]
MIPVNYTLNLTVIENRRRSSIIVFQVFPKKYCLRKELFLEKHKHIFFDPFPQQVSFVCFIHYSALPSAIIVCWQTNYTRENFSSFACHSNLCRLRTIVKPPLFVSGSELPLRGFLPPPSHLQNEVLSFCSETSS